MRNSIFALALVTVALAGCSTTRLSTEQLAAKVEAAKVCAKVEEPTRTQLKTFVFHPLPTDTVSTSGVGVIAGLTADDIADILENFQILKQREEKWNVRATAVNTCIDDAAKAVTDIKK